MKRNHRLQQQNNAQNSIDIFVFTEIGKKVPSATMAHFEEDENVTGENVTSLSDLKWTKIDHRHCINTMFNYFVLLLCGVTHNPSIILNDLFKRILNFQFFPKKTEHRCALRAKTVQFEE